MSTPANQMSILDNTYHEDSQPAAAKKKRACTECRKVKHRCDFTTTQSKCDRCIRLKRVCVPHVSRQGKRKEKPGIAAKAAVDNPATASGAQISTAGKDTMMMIGGPEIGNVFAQFQQQQQFANADASMCQTTSTSFAAPSVQPGTFVAPTNLNNNSFIHQQEEVEDPFTFYQRGLAEHRTGLGNAASPIAGQNQAAIQHRSPAHNNNGCGSLASGIAAPNLIMGSAQAFSASESVGHEQYMPSFNGNVITASTSTATSMNQLGSSPVANAKQNSCTSTTNKTMQIDSMNPLRIPLRQWISSALEHGGTNNSNHGISPLSPDYIMSCLRVATSISKQVSDMEEKLWNEKLYLLPQDIFTWADCVMVKLKQDGPDHNPFPGSANDSSPHASAADLELDRLEALFDSIEADDEYDEARFLDVDSAELLLSSTNLDIPNRDDSNLLSSQERQQRIFALGLVFYGLFSGGRLPPPEILTAEGSHVLTTLNLDKGKYDCDMNSNDIMRSNKPIKRQVSLQLHIDLLKLLGLSYSLCRLIHNMLDCTSDFSRNTTYKKMSDVTTDLQLMIEKPSIYLHDFDMAHLSSAGLQLDNFHMRNEEFASLKSAYQRSTAGSNEMVLVSGEAGAGKSFMVERLGRDIISNGGHFLSVKFGQLKSANPLSTLILAFNHYCSLLAEEKDCDKIKSMAAKLQNAFEQQDLYLLAKTIPKLSEILDIDQSVDDHSYEDCVNGEKKIHYLLTRFIEVMSSCSEVTVALCLDDCQWADSFSLPALEQILMLPKETNPFFIICCYRKDEVEDSHPFKKMTDRLNGFDVELTMIQLGCMNKGTVNKMISELLCLPPRLVTGLTDVVYSRTKGNPLFLSRLLESLNRNGLITLNLSERRWTWEEERIQSIKLSDDVASFFLTNIRKLSPQIQNVLQVLACFEEAEEKELLVLESNLGIELLQPLKLAIDEGLVCIKNGSYCFSHDKIMESVYRMADDRRCQHLTYGRCLAKEALVNRNDRLLYTAVFQFHLAGSSTVTDPVESAAIANLDLISGKKAMALCHHSLAAAYFKSGRSFLNESHWQSHYSLCLELSKLAAKETLIIGDFNYLVELAEQVDKHALCFGDKFKVELSVMTSLAYAKKIPQSVSAGLSILGQLGHELSTTWTRDNILFNVQESRKELASISDDDLMNYKKMTEPRHWMAMECLAEMQLTTFLVNVNPNLQPEVTLKMVNMTIKLGQCQHSPVAFAYYASLLAKSGEMRDSYRFAKLARSLLQQSNSKEIAGNVILSTSEVLSFFEPLLSVNENRSHGRDLALSVGDVHFGCMLRLTYVTGMLWSGSRLQSVKEAYVQSIQYAKQNGHMTSYFSFTISFHLIAALLGESQQYDTPTEDELTNKNQLLIFFFYRIAQRILLNIDDDAMYYAERFFEEKHKPDWLLISADAIQAFLGGLVAFRIYRKSFESKWLERARQCKSSIELWATQGSEWNFGQKLALLQAEESWCCMNFVDAEDSYESAIASARSHSFIIDEALSYELSGYFYLSAGMTAKALERFTFALGKYSSWGAKTKADILSGFIQEKFNDVPTSLSPCMGAGIVNGSLSIEKSSKRAHSP